ncbi:IS3 family transposase, partial [Pseudomonas avellanae]|uniref:IS3 family transposase n=2 Tax=Pseudomonas syringae group TaxID=136849 RepID=UPI00215643F6
FSQHFHADHPVFSCSKSEQKQLNTWVSFQSAEQPLLGQFSVSGNNEVINWLLWYNQERLHSTLHYVSPMQYEQNWQRQQP